MCENEFKAIVLAAGAGSRMREITNTKPKCLLPVGNLPLIWYPLSMLERAGFNVATIIVLEEEQNDIKKTLEKLDLKINLKYVTIKTEDDLGTADALRKVPKAGEKARDVLIVSCDLVTDQPLEKLLNVYRQHEAGLAALFFPCIPDPTPGSVPGPKSKQKPERDLVGLDPETSRLVFLASASDYEDKLGLRMRVLRKYKRVEMHSRLTDAHLYVISKHLWQFITSDDNSDSTLKGEVLPYIVKQQMSSLNKEEAVEDSGDEKNEEKLAFFKHIPRDELQYRVEKLSTWSDHPGFREGAYHGDRLRCFALVAKSPTLGTRVNTLAAYCDINRQILKSDKWTQLTGGRSLQRIDPSCTIKSKKLDMCLVGAGSQVMEGAKLERCNVGANCTVEGGAILADCTLLDNVTIGAGANLSNCLVCEKGVIGKSAKLKSCLVGNSYTVAEESSHEFEILTAVVMET